MLKLWLQPKPTKTDPIRVTLAESGLTWKEHEFAPGENATKVAQEKGGHLTTNLPMLHDVASDQYFTHQTAILRFVGRKSGLYPTATVGTAAIGAASDIDTLISASEDLLDVLNHPLFKRAQTEKDKLESITFGFGGGVRSHFDNFKRLLGAGPWFGPSFSVADLAVYNALALAQASLPNTLAEASLAPLVAFTKRVEARPKVAKWLGGDKPAATPAAADAPTGPLDWNGLLSEAGLEPASIVLTCPLAELSAAYAEGRPAVLNALKANGVGKLPDRQKIATALAKALKAGRELRESTAEAPEEPGDATPPPPPPDVSDADDGASDGVAEPVTLYYWPAHGRGEMVRLVLAEAGVSWEQPTWEPSEDEDENTARRDEYFKMCRGLGGHLTTNIPMVHIDGRHVTQTASVLRYLGRRLGLYPARVDGAEQLAACHRIDVLIALADELRDLNYKAAQGISITRMMYAKSQLPPHLANFDQLLGEAEYFSPGGAPSVGDLTVYDVLIVAEKQVPGCLDKHPALVKFRARVAARPGVAAYLTSERKAQLPVEQKPVVNPDGSPVKPPWEE